MERELGEREGEESRICGTREIDSGEENRSKIKGTIKEGAVIALKRKLTIHIQRPTRMTPTNNLSNREKANINALS